MKNERPIGYRMTRKMFNNLLSKRKESEKKINPYVYVMNIINEEWGLRGKVTRISIFEDC